MSSDTTIGMSKETHEALKKERRKGETLGEAVSRLINESNDGEVCPECGSPMKVAKVRPFNLFTFDLECTNPNCDYGTEYEALKGVRR